MKILFLNLLLLIPFISIAEAQTKYFCTGDDNSFFIIFDFNKKTVTTRNGNLSKYWNEANYIFWQSAKNHTVYEYTFKNSYNKLSGTLKVKSHHLVTSKNRWYDYDCSVNQ